MYEVNFTLGVRLAKTGWRKVLVRKVGYSSELRDGEVPIRIRLKIPDELIDGHRVEMVVPVSVERVEGDAR